MILITKAERKAIVARYPGAYIVTAKHHVFLAGYENSPQAQYLKQLRGGRKKPGHKK